MAPGKNLKFCAPQTLGRFFFSHPVICWLA